MQFPNDVRCVLLFNSPPSPLETIRRQFLNISLTNPGVLYSEIEADAGLFYRLSGTNGLMVTMEFIDAPARQADFQEALTSPITTILCPDASKRLQDHKSQILIGVSFAAATVSALKNPTAQFLDPETTGATLPQYLKRLEACAMLAQIAQEDTKASLVHWRQSNILLSGEQFEASSQEPIPNLLHAHPVMTYGEKSAKGGDTLSVQTFGVRGFIGREVRVEPNELGWREQLDAILIFLRLAINRNGYIVPNGHTFGTELKTASFRVIHRSPVQGRVPLYGLELITPNSTDTNDANYISYERMFNDPAPLANQHSNHSGNNEAAANHGGRPPPVPGLWQIFWRRFGFYKGKYGD